MVYDYDEIYKIYDHVRESDFEIVKFMIDKAGITEESNISFLNYSIKSWRDKGGCAFWDYYSW